MIKDMTGERFGLLKVIERAPSRRKGRAAWLCECECGKRCVVTGKDLQEKKTQSCGCLRRKSAAIRDLTGQYFGLLKAKCPTDKRDYKGSVIWHCECRCGNSKEVSSDKLLGDNTVSCCCKQRENQRNLNKTLHRIDGTCVEHLKRKMRSDNTSGYTGIFIQRNGRCRVAIGFKGVRHHLGTYDTLEEALAARRQGEEYWHNAFLNDYNRNSDC